MERLKGILYSSLFVVALGCGSPGSTTVTDTEGNKVTSTKDGEKVTFEGAKGEKATYEADGKGGGSMTYTTPEGEQKVTTGAGITETELGLPFYPGSVEKEGGSMKTDTPQGSSRIAVRTTADAPSKVVAFYKPKLKETNAISANGQEILMGKLEDGSQVQIGAGKEEGKPDTVVSVTVIKEKG